MIKLTSLAANRSYRLFFRSRKSITALKRKVHQSSNGAAPTEKSNNTELIGTAGLYCDEVLKCTEDVCGNASDSEFLASSTIPIFNQGEELVTAEDENDETLSFSDGGTANEHETVRIFTTRDAMYVAFKLLAKRGLSVTELTNILSEKFPLDIVDEVIDDMKTRGYLNDGLYAESFSRSRFLNFLWGPGLIKQALLLKGIHDAEAEKAIRRVLHDNYDYHNNMLNITISKDSTNYSYDVEEEEISQSAMDYLFLQASKHWNRQKNISIESRKAGMIRWLRDRGLSPRVIGAILKRLWSERF